MRRFAELLRRMPAYARLAWRIGRDPSLTTSRRAALVGAMAYLASPIDLVPGFIPVAGQLDDAAVALLGLRFALRGLPASQRDGHLAATGLAADHLDADLATVRDGGAWMVRRGGRVARSTARGLGQAALAAGRMAIARGRDAVVDRHAAGRRP